MDYWGIEPRNKGQVAAVKALSNEKPFTFLTGPAGTGKTLITQAVGMHRTLEKKDFKKLIYTRMQIQLGEAQGFLPGSLDEKTYPFIRPFLDNLEVMSSKGKEILNYLTTGQGDKKKIYFDAIQTMRGASVHNSFLMVDEVQNLDVPTMLALATRPVLGTKIIFMGNFSQVDTPKLRRPDNNGLFLLLKGLYEEQAHQYFDHINLTEIERHPVITLVEKILRNHEMDPRFEALEQRGNVI